MDEQSLSQLLEILNSIDSKLDNLTNIDNKLINIQTYLENKEVKENVLETQTTNEPTVENQSPVATLDSLQETIDGIKLSVENVDLSNAKIAGYVDKLDTAESEKPVEIESEINYTKNFETVEKTLKSNTEHIKANNTILLGVSFCISLVIGILISSVIWKRLN